MGRFASFHLPLLLFLSQLSTCSAGFQKQSLAVEKSAQIWSHFVARKVHVAMELQPARGEYTAMLSIQSTDTGKLLFSLEVDLRTNFVVLTLPTCQGENREHRMRAPLADGESHKIVFRMTDKELYVIENCKQLLRVEEDNLQFEKTNNVEVITSGFTNREVPSSGLLYGLSIENVELVPFPCASLEVLIEDHETYVNKETPTPRIEKVENQVNILRTFFGKLDRRVSSIERQIRPCLHKNRALQTGERVPGDEECTECTCTPSGELVCGPIGCPIMDCAHPTKAPGECCPVCLKKCEHNGKMYDDGEEVWQRECVRCNCNDGEMSCQYIHPSTCPHLNCTDQVTRENECCPVCANRDFCAEKPCDKYAKCKNTKTKAVCQCELGFFGNGTYCYDMDECLWNKDAREQLGGCADGTICVNLPGTFRCDCLPGFQKLTEKSCLNLIRF